MSAKLPQLVSSMLSVQRLSETKYRSDPPHMSGIIGPRRLFGGYVVAQVYRICKTITSNAGGKQMIRSIHYNFVGPGKLDEVIDFDVTREEDVIRVNTFHEKKQLGLSVIKLGTELLSGPCAPKIPSVADVPTLSDQLLAFSPKHGQKGAAAARKYVFELRPVHYFPQRVGTTAFVAFYARLQPESRHVLSEDDGMEMIVAMSDFSIMRSVDNMYIESGFKMQSGASLQHNIYFHKDKVEGDQWFLMVSKAVIVTGNKALIQGQIYDSSRSCVISFIQEAYCVREKAEEKTSKL